MGNLEEMLKEHEKQINMLSTRVVLTKVKTKITYNDNGQNGIVTSHGRNSRKLETDFHDGTTTKKGSST
ncbi:hypothetical protein AAG906_035455 [Vitis piasezkii]